MIAAKLSYMPRPHVAKQFYCVPLFQALRTTPTLDGGWYLEGDRQRHHEGRLEHLSNRRVSGNIHFFVFSFILLCF